MGIGDGVSRVDGLDGCVGGIGRIIWRKGWCDSWGWILFVKEMVMDCSLVATA